MGAQGALDFALSLLLGRLGPNYLLVPHRSLDFARLHALTGHDTDYGLVANRATSKHAAFEPEEAFTLAANLTSRLTPADRLSILDAAASLFSDIAPTDSFDGEHPAGMTENCDNVTAVASLIWNALGDPASATRWLAAHAVHLLLSIESSRLPETLCGVAMGNFDPIVFRDRRLPFYDKHATQWLIFALSRASLEACSLHSVAKFAPLLQQVLEGPRHAVTSPLAREVVLRLQRAGMLPTDMDWPSPLESIGRPIEVQRRSWQSGGRVVRSFSELNDLAQSNAGIHTLDEDADDRTVEDKLEAANSGEGKVKDTFRFFFDFRAYWCDPLARAFGLTATSIETLVNEVLLDRWQVKSRGQVEDDARHELRLYPQSTYSQKSEWPPEEDLDFYLAVHGLYEVAGSLLQLLPVGQTYDEDEETGETEYSRFLSHHVPTRADGRWLSDRADAVPLRAEAFSGSGGVGGSRSHETTWPFEVNATMFWDELQPEPNRLSISASRSVQDYIRHETVHVSSALVAPATARSLLRAMQNAPDTRAFRLPDASDHEFTCEVAGFELTGWIEEHGYAEGIDSEDPLATGMHYPPQRPSTGLPALAELIPDPDMRLWRDENAHIVFISSVWDDTDGETSPHGSAGHQLLIDRPSLSGLLQRLNRWLIVEVQIRRYVERSTYRGHDIGRNDDEQFPYLEPYTKYFLVDLVGGIHDQ